MTDETTILLEVLAIQLHESAHPGKHHRNAWHLRGDGCKQSYRRMAREWFENNRTANSPTIDNRPIPTRIPEPIPTRKEALLPIKKCTNCKADYYGMDNVCPFCGSKRIEL